MYFDSHAHYSDPQFDKDRRALLASLAQEGVEGVVECASDFQSAERVLELTQAYDFIYGAVGVHPEAVRDLEVEDMSMLYSMIASSEKTVAVGEIGLDYHYKENAAPGVQREWFIEQIELAKELELPVIVHSRDAAQDTFEILRDYDGAMFGGVLHSYSGSVEMARQYVEMGFYLGIGGMVTFTNARKTAAVVAEIPLEHLLIETDCPYLAPVPVRGKRNDSRNLCYIAEKIAQIKGISSEEVARVTAENARELFRL